MSTDEVNTRRTGISMLPTEATHVPVDYAMVTADDNADAIPMKATQSMTAHEELKIPDHMKYYGLPLVDIDNNVKMETRSVQGSEAYSSHATFKQTSPDEKKAQQAARENLLLLQPQLLDQLLTPPYVDASHDKVTEVKPSNEEMAERMSKRKVSRSHSTAEIVSKNSNKLRNIPKEFSVDTRIIRSDGLAESGDFKGNSYLTSTLFDKFTSSQNSKYASITKVAQGILSFVLGCVFGWMLQKSAVYKPRVIRNQFLFKEFIMLKAFLAAMLVGTICLMTLFLIPSTTHFFKKTRQIFACGFTNKGILSTVTGGALLGGGMAVAGACPGMVLAQVGSAVPNSAFTLIGCFLGSLLYGFLDEKVEKIFTPKKPYKTLFIDTALKWRYWALALPMVVLLIVVVVLMEVYIPENQFVLMNNQNQSNSQILKDEVSGIFSKETWLASICGGFIGLLQLPVVLFLSDTLGSSSGYQGLVSQWVWTKNLQERFPYFAKNRTSFGNMWQIAYLLGAVSGAALAAYSANSFGLAAGVPWYQGLIGGFLMLVGSRAASGCTSGHGLSGTALLAGLSFLAVAAMFAGGIAVVFIMEFSGQNVYSTTWLASQYIVL